MPDKTVIAKPFSGDYRIDVLIDDINYRWNAGKTLGTAVEISYSFIKAPASYASDSDKNGFKAFTAEQMAAARAIFTEISQVLNVTFKEVADTDIQSGIRLANNIQEKSAGYAKLPVPTADGTAFSAGSGDLFMSTTYMNVSYEKGSEAYKILIHEIGHALGLNHPGNYNAGEPPSAEAGNYLATAEDSSWISIMSYNAIAQNQQGEFFATYDMLALKYLYGSKAFHTGDDVYAYSDVDGRTLKIINDTGGVDTIDVSKVSAAVTINLTPGSLNSVGRIANGDAAINNLSIAFDATIENIIGTAFNDKLTGNAASNLIRGGGGDDVIDGGAGMDTAQYSGLRSAFTVTGSGSGFTVSKPSSQGVDTLSNVERLKFSDLSVALDIDGIAGQAYRIYQAAFGRTPDLAGLGYWIKDMDKGSSLTTVAAGFMQSKEFQTLYGANPSVDTFLTTLYKNILGRVPDQAGYDYWKNEISANRISFAGTLASFTEGQENKVKVIGTIQNGIDFIEYLG
ncbi:M57 family metalloprotease [Undibacterium pigrum]|uniref:Reprolysin-like metallo-peptidase family M12B n=1 Tax=Undibacterium pigrum TaxID=401470 RepID=A0A318IW47_9BURK|nr:M57 family metalloprotease [Undibacterium pigrum]PXX39679.1 reprolysin-like metallo-peptidase family M12B [Undibacterium pigrum]